MVTKPWNQQPDSAFANLLIQQELLGPGVPVLFVPTNPNGTQGRQAQMAIALDTGVLWQNTAGGTVWGALTIGGGGAAAGALLNRQVFTATGVYTPTAGTNKVRLQLQAPGGGSGSVATSVLAMGYAGSGGVFWQKYVNPGAAVIGGAVTIGAFGVGGAAGGSNAGTDGGDVSIVVNGTTYTAKGGIGGISPGAQVPPVGNASTAGGSVAASTAGFDVAFSAPSTLGFQVAGMAVGQQGGPSFWGGGGRGGFASTGGSSAGIDGVGFGSGAGGTVNVNQAISRAGSNGAPGLIIVEEYS